MEDNVFDSTGHNDVLAPETLDDTDGIGINILTGSFIPNALRVGQFKHNASFYSSIETSPSQKKGKTT